MCPRPLPPQMILRRAVASPAGPWDLDPPHRPEGARWGSPKGQKGSVGRGRTGVWRGRVAPRGGLRWGPNTLPGREVSPSSGRRSPRGQPGGAAVPPKAQGGERLGAGRGQGCGQQAGLEHETVYGVKEEKSGFGGGPALDTRAGPVCVMTRIDATWACGCVSSVAVSTPPGASSGPAVPDGHRGLGLWPQSQGQTQMGCLSSPAPRPLKASSRR